MGKTVPLLFINFFFTYKLFHKINCLSWLKHEASVSECKLMHNYSVYSSTIEYTRIRKPKFKKNKKIDIVSLKL